MTTRTTRRISSLLNLIVILAMMFASPLQMTAQAYTETDQEDYTPGSEVLIYGDNSNFDTAAGEGYKVGETVRVTVIQPVLPDPLTCDAVVGETGYWECKIQLSTDPAYAVGYYEYVTLGLESGTTETHFFTDANVGVGTYDQCANGTGGSGPTCNWTNGNLQQSNSMYTEGDATVQRLWLTGMAAGSTHTVTLKYGTTKGGKHAYDFLTTWNWSENWITQTDLCSGITGCMTAAQDTLAIPVDPNAGGFDAAIASRLFTMRGGDMTSATTPTIISGSYTGDSETVITITFTVPSTGAMCYTSGKTTLCDVVLWFGAHVAAQADWGIGTGAGNITGSPYHVALDAVDGDAIGQRDNQMQSGAVIPNGSVVIVKDAVPNDAQDFSFRVTNGLVTQNFLLDDDSDITLPNSRTFSLPPGIWTASELSIPAGWNLTNLVCVDPTSNTTVSLATATATINLASAETVTCTFIDTKGGNIIVVKQTDPDGMAGSFEFDPSWGNNFFLSDGQSNDSGMLPPGTYSVAEVNLSPVWQFTGATCSDGSPITAIDLQAGETVTCTFNNTRLWNKDLTVSKTAVPSFGRTYSWDIYKNVDKTTASIPDGGSATFNYTVGVTHDSGTDSGWVVSGEITVTNPNAFDVAGVNLSDAIDKGGSCTVTDGANLTIPANSSLKRAYSCTFTSAPGSGTNTATATWDAATYNTPSGSASGTAGYDFAGVTPSITNGSVTITDTLGGNLGTLTYTDPSPKEFTYSYTFSGVGGTCTKYDNTATITENGKFAKKTVEVCVGKDLTVTKTATASLNRLYKWLIDKSVDDTRIEIAEGGLATFNYDVTVTPNGYTDSGWVLGGTITITNPNDWEAVTVAVTDTLDKGGTCAITETAPYVVPKSGTLTLHYTCTSDGTTTKNTAAVTWDKAAYFTPGDSASADAAVTFAVSGETNKTITVIDDKTDPANPIELGTWNWADGPHTFEYALEKQGVAGECTDYTNTAVIDETDQSDSQKVTVCVGKDLTVSKTAIGSFNRTYLWTIDKSVDKTEAKIAAGGKATFHYTVDVAQTGISDSGWTLSGVITITNPNKWQAVTLTGLTDVADIGASCSVAPGPYVVPADGTLDVAYSCTFGSAPTSYSGRNTATATWDKAAAFTPNGTASGFNDFTLSQIGATNKTIHVTDTYAGDLGTVTATDAAPFASASFSYDREIEGVAGTCTDYDNTATITETGQSADQTVTVCVGLDLTVSKTASGNFAREYLWDITKVADKTQINIAEGGAATFNYTVKAFQTGILDSGWTLSGEITLTNPNDWESITLTSLSDVVDNGGLCTVDAGPYVVPMSGILKVGYTCSYASDPTSYSGTNTATATWDAAAYFTPSGSANGSKSFILTQASAKNETIHVTDTLGGPLGTVTATNAEPWASAEFKYPHVFIGVAGTCTNYDNTATIVETEDTASQTVTVCVGKDLKVTKTAAGTFHRTYFWKIDKSVDDTRIDMPFGGTATFHYTVKVTPDGYTDSGWTMGGTITVSNPNDWEAITADVTDTFPGGTCTVIGGVDVVIPAGQSVTLDYSCAFASQPAYTGTNTATAAWDKALYFTPTGEASGTADVTLGLAGETNRTITVVDDKTDPANPITLGTSDYYAGPFEFTYSLDKTGVAGKCTDYTNIATILETKQSDDQKVTVCTGLDLKVSKTAAGTFHRTYFWKIDKSVDDTRIDMPFGGIATFHYTVKVTPDGYTDSGWTMGGTITVSNPNDWEAITADVTDTFPGGTCTVIGGVDVVIPAGQSVTLDYSCTFASQPAYTGTNTATAAWDKALYFTPNGEASGTADVTLGLAGETNRTITVVDDQTTGTPVTLGTSDYYAGPFEFTYSLDKAGVAGKCTDYTNTATIDETKQSDDQTVTVCTGLDLKVSKTAAGTFDREYFWLIDKSVDDTRIDMPFGGIATFNYTVKVTPNGYTDSGWTMGGTITVSNPNDWEAITADVTDTFPGGTCTVTGGVDVVIPAGQSVTLNYSCAFASQPAYTGTNTATANWDAAAFFTPTGEASGTADVTLGLTGETNRTITVVDDKTDPLNPVTLGTSDYYAGPFTYTYSLDKAGVAGKCTDYTNTATILETKQSDDQTVTVCTGLDLTVTKTAVPTFTRTWDWTITKDFDATYNLFAGNGVTHGYKVTVDPTFTDSLWKVVGVITISNPNLWQDVTLTSLTDTTDLGGSCTVAAGPYVVPANGTLDVAYTCTWDVMPISYSGLNTATAAWNKATAFTPNDSASGESGFAFDTKTAGNPTEINPVITVDDDNLTGETWSADRAYAEWSYTKDFACSTNPADYIDGKYSYSHTNTATIKETVGDSDTATVTVNCYAPVVSKTAAGTYDERHEWDVEKTVDPTSQDLLAGSTGKYTWTVTVTETVFEENFAAAGEIFITNPHPTDAMTVALSDQLSDGFAATITGCTDGVWDATAGTVTVEVGKKAVCAYTASLTYDDDANAPTKNTVTAKFNGLTTTAEAAVKWAANIIRAEATLDDDQNPLFPLTISESGTWTYEETYTCSTDQSSYTNGKYAFNDTNTAIITSGNERDRDTADTSITCHAPVVSKTAETYWNRDWDWTITKEYDGSYNLFAGDTVTHGYKVTVDPTYTDNFWGVKGTITVTNSHPTEAMTLTDLTDLAGGIAGEVECPSLVVPAGGSLTCTYDTGAQDKPNANPFGDKNIATAVFSGANWTGEKAIVFSATPTTEDEPVITVNDDNLTGEDWSADRAAGEWTYTKDFTCSTDPTAYTDGKYSYSHTNTATITETGQKDTATVDVTCYMPQIELTKTGDELSKIGDGVTYDITLTNNTPTDAGLRALSCTITDAKIGFSKTVVLASGAKDENLNIPFVIPSAATDPFVNTASVTCKPVAATSPVVGDNTFSVSDSASWETNLFQPKVEIVKTGPASATPGATITYTFTINNLSSSDSPNLMLDTISDDKLGDLKALALAAGCDNLPYNGTCTFTKTFTLPTPPEPFLQSFNHTNVVSVLYHPAGFPNDITDTDDHTVIVTPQGQLTDTSFCPLPNNLFRLLYHLAVAPNIYRLQSSNPGQFYYNAFYYGEPGEAFTMTIEIPYPFVTQEGAGNPIQVHDGTYLTSSGCFNPYPALSGFTILTEAMTPTSPAGNQIITPEDYTTKLLGETTTVTVSGVVPASGMAYVTIHLDYGLKKTNDWKAIGTYTVNPVSGASIADMRNGSGSGPITLHGYQEYTFSRTAPDGTFTTNPASYNELKKFAGFLGFVSDAVTGNPKVNVRVQIKGPTGTILATLTTDEDGYYMYAYKHKARSATYTVKLPDFGKSQSVTVKANGFAAVDFEITGGPTSGTLGGRITIPRITVR